MLQSQETKKKGASFILKAIGLIIALVGVVIGAKILVVQGIKGEIRQKFTDLSLKIGRDITISDISLSLFDDILIDGLTVSGREEPLLRIEKVRMGFSLIDLITRKKRPNHLLMENVEMNLTLNGLEIEEFIEIRERLGESSGKKDITTDNILPQDFQVLHANIFLHRSNDKENPIKIEEIYVSLQSENGDFVFSSEGTLRYSSTISVPFKIKGKTTSHKSLYVSFIGDKKIPLSKLIQTSLPISIKGVSLELQEKRFEIKIEDVWITNLKDINKAYLRKADSFSAEQVEIEGNVDLGAIINLASIENFEKISRISIHKAQMSHVLIENMPNIPLDIKEIEASITKDEEKNISYTLKAYVTREEDIEDTATFESKGVLSPAFRFQQGIVKVEGHLPVHILSILHNRVLPWPQSKLSLEAKIMTEGEKIIVVGNTSGKGLTYFWTKVCLVPVSDLQFQADFKAEIYEKRFHLKLDPIKIAEAFFMLDMEVLKQTPKPSIYVVLRIPMQDCQKIADSIPKVMIPRLDGARFQGQLRMEIKAKVDLKNVYATKLEVDAETEDCKVLTLGPLIDIDALNGQYLHRVVEEDLDQPIYVGPGTESYVEIKDIPEHVQQSALATEDMGFFKHKGFKLGLIRRAVALNLDKGWYVYGGSTITQQLAKNLFLSREKTLARKLEEAVIVWQMERTLSKERILELYLNCIEFGKHIYGIKEAAKVYFNKEPKDLTPLEAAFIMATKPAPRYAYNVYKKGVFNQWWVDRMQGILKRLWQEMKVIDEATYLEAAPYLPDFWYPEEGVHRKPMVEPGVVVPPGMPKDLPKEDKAGPPTDKIQEGTTEVEHKQDQFQPSPTLDWE